MTPRQLMILTIAAGELAVIITGYNPVTVGIGVIAGFTVMQRITRGSNRKS